jgi:hypothetical protein
MNLSDNGGTVVTKQTKLGGIVRRSASFHDGSLLSLTPFYGTGSSLLHGLHLGRFRRWLACRSEMIKPVFRLSFHQLISFATYGNGQGLKPPKF